MRTRSSRSLVFLLASLGLLSACDDSGGDASVIPDLSTSFVSSLDETELATAPVIGTHLRVTVRSKTQPLSTVQSAVWVGLQDGTADLFTVGQAASAGLERLAEDGDSEGIEGEFASLAGAGRQRTLNGVLDPTPGNLGAGEQVTHVFRVDPMAPTSRYLSYLSQIRPSNDGFVGNDSPTQHEMFDVGGSFVGTDFVVLGTSTLDAGTEVNDEISTNVAGWEQAAPNTGIDELGTIASHPGYLPPLSNGILAQPEFFFALFLLPTYEYMSVSVSEEPVLQTASGSASYQLSSTGNSLGYDITVSNLSGPVTTLEVWEGAPGADGIRRLDITPGIDVNEGGVLIARGAVNLNNLLRERVLGGDLYLQVGTALNPAGEVRGQIQVGDDTTYYASLSESAVATPPVRGRDVRVSIYNSAPDAGTWLSPVWVGFHDGSFDIYDLGSSAAAFFPLNNGLESLAEDGATASFDLDFQAANAGTIFGTIGGLGGPFEPGETASRIFRLHPEEGVSQYFSYATMLLPSNDAFMAEADPTEHMVYDPNGIFRPVEFLVSGSGVRDAGTEVNDELPANTAFFGQATPNTGTTEGGTVGVHPGFLAAGSGGILDDPMFAAADFLVPFYRPMGVLLQEVAGTPAEPMGSVIARYDAGNEELTVDLFVDGLSGAATAVGLYPGSPGNVGAQLYDLSGGTTTNESGRLELSTTVAITATDLSRLNAGNLYLRVDTALNPTGELRGQLGPGL